MVKSHRCEKANVFNFDRQKRQLILRNLIFYEGSERSRHLVFSQAHLDGDLPKARDTGVKDCFGIGDGIPKRSCKRLQTVIENSYQDVGIEQKAHGSRERPQQKVLGQRSIEIICNESDD